MLQLKLEVNFFFSFRPTYQAGALHLATGKYEAALKVKDDEVSFLRGHVAQLTQSISQLSLPPSQDEARRRHWYQFWK